ncbi:MAG: glycosyltransferase family 39 protein [Ruthenibacterium sp.]
MKQNKIYRLFCMGFALLFGAIVLDAIFNNKTQVYTYRTLWLILCTLLCGALLWGAYRLWTRKTPHFSAKREIVCVACFLSVFFVLQLVVAWCMAVAVTPGWDFGIVFGAARDMVLYGTMPDLYFANFPNNAPTYLFLVFLFRLFHLFGCTDFLAPAIVVNTLFVQLSLFLFYLTLRKLFAVKNALFGLLLSFFCLPFLLYGPIVYTDTLTMPFPIATLLLWLYARDALQNGRIKRGILLCLAAGSVCALGAKLKITVLIVLIALLIDACLTAFSVRKKMLTAACTLGAFCLIFALQGVFAAHTALLPAYDKDDAIPYTHWVMMGLSGVGGYNNDDYDLTLRGKTYAERQSITTQEIASRVKALGVRGLAHHSANKLSYIYGDGLCYAPYKLDQSGLHDTILRQFFLAGFPYFGAVSHLATGLWLAVLCCGIWGAVSAARKSTHSATVFYVALIGLTLFLLLWEARSRYLVNFLPIILICGMNGLFCDTNVWYTEFNHRKTKTRRTARS